MSVICPGFVSEAGMFARRQRQEPGIVAACKPADVAAAVVAAISKRKPDVLVTPRPSRPLVALQAISARAVTALTEKLGLRKFLYTLTRD